MNPQLASIDQIKNTVLDLAIRFGPKLLIAILILAVGFAVSRWVSRWFLRGLSHVELEPPVRTLLARVAWALTLAVFVILALQNLGVELLPLIAGLGVAGAGVALATQGVLSNVVAGLSIIFTRPFKVGEYISIVNEEGTVEDITLFTTTLSHLDFSRVVIPNRKIAGEILHNYGELRQLNLSVGVAYDTDLNQALATIQGILKSNPRVLQDPAPLIQVSTLAESAVNIGVRPWVNVLDYPAAIGELNQAMVETFRERGITIPFPQREVRLLGNTA